MCSIPIDWNATIGSQQPIIFPGTLLLTDAIVTPRQTSQLAITPRRKARKKPNPPSASYFFSTLIWLSATIFCATRSQIGGPMLSAAASMVPLVRLSAMNNATAAVPAQLPSHTQPQFTNVAFQEVFPAQHAIGRSAKLPVTSSMPNSTMLAKPKGNKSEPTKGSLVRMPQVRARITARPRIDPE